MFTPLFPSFLDSPEAVTLIKVIAFYVSLISQSLAAVALTATHFMRKNMSQENMAKTSVLGVEHV